MKKFLSLIGLFVWALPLATAFSQTTFGSFWSKLFNRDSIVAKPEGTSVDSPLEAAPEAASFSSDAAPTLATSKCEGYRPYLEQAKAEMGKKNDLERNACQLYKSWAELWRASDCDAQAFADASAVQCSAALGSVRFDAAATNVSAIMRPSCDEIFGKWQTASNWTHAGIQACDYSLFETGCRPMAEAAEDCGAWQCAQNCTLKYACDPAGFKALISATPVYFNDPPRLQGCMENLRRAGL
ncbi:MAG: hypothetical protein IT572_04895 [Deltaproteobacteria bacterium]|nr:hypothetical protein [Deltaproteobacteria bacterium]